ncbi:hypothetical protein GCM10023116_29660 [Kistimonas scapharcae]|uniref:Uncharacterized protein n=1 Tax=Kistimonas scapharcae TaxID=1036133 RepID=A0ABP8V382_9GAMM
MINTANATIKFDWKPSPSGLIGNLSQWQLEMLRKYPDPEIGEMYNLHINLVKNEEVAYRFMGWFDDEQGRVQHWRREARQTARVSFLIKLKTRKGDVVTTPDGLHFRDVSFKDDNSRYDRVFMMRAPV